MSKLIESPGKVILRWVAEDGREFWAEIEPSDKGLEIYIDGEGSAEATVRQDSINFLDIEIKLMADD